MRDEIYSREMGWMELFSKALHIFSMNMGAVIKVMVLIFLPISILQGVILERMTASSALLTTLMDAEQMLQNQAEMMPVLMQTLTNEALYFAVLLFLEPVGVIALAKLTRQRINGQPLNIKRALTDALALEPTIILTGILYGVLVFLGGMLVIPGIYLSIAWCLYLYCIGLGEQKGWAALRHSQALVRGKWWKTLGYYLLMAVIGMLWNQVFSWIYAFGTDSVAKDILYYFLCYFSGAFVATGMALLFLNREAMLCGWQNMAGMEEDTEKREETEG